MKYPLTTLHKYFLLSGTFLFKLMGSFGREESLPDAEFNAPTSNYCRVL